MSVRGTVKSFFRSSKTVDNMSNHTTNGHNRSVNSSICSQALSKLKSSSPLLNNQLSHSQPIVTESSVHDNNHFESSLISHSEQTPLIDRRKESKYRNHVDNTVDTTNHNDNGNNNSNNNNNNDNDNNDEEVRLNRHALHLPLETDGLYRSHSCTDGIKMPPANPETNLSNGTSTVPTIVSNLQPNFSDVISSRSTDSSTSLLSTYLSPQQTAPSQRSAPTQTNGTSRNDLSKSQESLFSFSSPVQKQRSFKSLLMAATSQDPATKQGNEVLVLIAGWVLRSPEDFQGK